MLEGTSSRFKYQQKKEMIQSKDWNFINWNTAIRLPEQLNGKGEIETNESNKETFFGITR
jgi:hypothetical protein